MADLFDSHAHLDDDKFDCDREETINKIFDSGVCAFVNIGADMESSKRSIALASKYDNVYATVGIHPHDVSDMTEADIEELEQLAKHKKVVAIGEIGLDYFYDNSPRDKQKYWFARQLQLAEKLNMPVTIHNRDAHADTMEILKNSKATGIIHCYSGSAEMAKQLVDMGFYISFAGPVTYKNSKNAVQSALAVPMDRILIETDSPYLAPDGFRGKRNDSSLVRYVCEKLAEIKGVTFEEMAKQTKENAKRVYRIED